MVRRSKSRRAPYHGNRIAAAELIRIGIHLLDDPNAPIQRVGLGVLHRAGALLLNAPLPEPNPKAEMIALRIHQLDMRDEDALEELRGTLKSHASPE